MSHRLPVRDNSGLIVSRWDSRARTSPARFLEIGPHGAALEVEARPRVGDVVHLCQLEPVLTDWIAAIVVGVELWGDSDSHVEVAFRAPLSAEMMNHIGGRQPPTPAIAPGADHPEMIRRILVVDDDDQTRGALALLLRRRGYHVITAGSVAEGMSHLDPPPCGILLDLTLPDGPGEAILDQLHRCGLAGRVTVCTGTHDADRLERVEDLHPRALLQKPVRVSDLIDACAAMVG